MINEADPLPTANGSVHKTSCVFNCHLHFVESASTSLLISSISFPGISLTLSTGGIYQGGCQRLERMSIFYSAPPFVSYLYYCRYLVKNQVLYRFWVHFIQASTLFGVPPVGLHPSTSHSKKSSFCI